MAMTQYEAFLADILEHPEDDTPRLVYADWLDENAGTVPCGRCEGDGSREVETTHGYSTYWMPCGTCSGTGRVPDGNAARSEFIRCQVDLAGLPGCAFLALGQEKPCCETARATSISCRHCALRRRERELLNANYARWTNFLPARIALQNVSTDCWRRGFVESVTCAAAAWLAHGDAIRRCQPVTRVRLTTGAGFNTSWGEITFSAVAREFTCTRFSGVTFELPRANRVPQTANYDPG